MLDKIRWFWRYYRHHKKVIAILVFLTPIQAAIVVTVPRMVGFTIDYLRDGVVSDHWLAQLIVKWLQSHQRIMV